MANSAFRAAAAACLGAALLVSAGAMSASASVITFDDVDTANPEVAVPNGYAGLNWDNFSTIDPDHTKPSPITVGGFPNSRSSGAYSAFNLDGDPASISSATAFNLISGNFTSAYSNAMTLTITGYLGGTQVGQVVVHNLTTALMAVTLDLMNVDKVTFSASAASDIDGRAYPRTFFAVDDLNVAKTPIPGSLLLLLTGCGALGALGIARRRATAAGAQA
jgi:hypothetical protein